MADQKLLRGMTVDGFALEERLRRAGAAECWRVSRSDICEPLQMKLPGDQRVSPSLKATFEVEQMILAEVSGPHVPRLVASGMADGRPYLVMEHVAGQMLSALLAGRRLPPDEAVRCATALADALADLHQQHILHLALSPDAIMMRSSGEAVFVDLGYSRHEHFPDLLDKRDLYPVSRLTYLAPEQFQRCRSDKRSDIFALGAVLYEMVTGEMPFGVPSGLRQARQRVWREPVPPRALLPELEPAFQEVILKCLDPHPGARYASAEALAFDLRHLDLVELTERSGRAARADRMTTFRRWMRSRHTMAAITAAATRPGPRVSNLVAVIDLRPDCERERQALIEAAVNALANMPGARLSCLCLLPAPSGEAEAAGVTPGRDRYAAAMAGLRAWAEPLRLPRGAVSYHVVEAQSLAKGLADFVKSRKADRLVIGDGEETRGLPRTIAANSPCAVTIVPAAAPRSRRPDIVRG